MLCNILLLHLASLRGKGLKIILSARACCCVCALARARVCVCVRARVCGGFLYEQTSTKIFSKLNVSIEIQIKHGNRNI